MGEMSFSIEAVCPLIPAANICTNSSLSRFFSAPPRLRVEIRGLLLRASRLAESGDTAGGIEDGERREQLAIEATVA
jgi:hypothetical protein